MNIKIHLIISNFLQILYVIVNALGIILRVFDADKIVLFNMIWCLVILLVYAIHFFLYRKEIHFYRGMDKKIYANFDRQWTKRFSLTIAEIFIIPAIVIMDLKDISTAILLSCIFIVEFYFLLKSFVMKNIVTKEFIKLNEFNDEKSKLVITNLELTSFIDNYNKKMVNKTQLIKQFNSILDKTYIIRVFYIIDDNLCEYKYGDKLCFTTFELAELHFKKDPLNQVAKLWKFSQIIEDCIYENRKLKIYYSKNKSLKLNQDELKKILNK